MTTYVRWFMIVGLAGAVAACAGETAVPRDGGPSQEAGQLDQGLSPDWGQLDQTVGGNSCNEVLDCVVECEIKSCATECIAGGASGAQTLINELLHCLEVARTGACQQQCTTPSSAECYSCVDRQCGEERHACFFGNPLPGFGDPCDEVIECADVLTCAGQQATGQGYCTYTCETPNEICPGASLEAYSSCITPIEGSGFVCGFVCKINATTYRCPAPQVCSTAEAPPAGSGVYLCEAPSI